MIELDSSEQETEALIWSELSLNPPDSLDKKNNFTWQNLAADLPLPPSVTLFVMLVF